MQLIEPEETLLVAYSGGADSTCLLHLCAEIGVDVVAAHLHHGMRAEADEEEQKCIAFAESLGIPIVTGRADVPLIAETHKIGLEEAGREARKNFLRRAMLGSGCHKIATGHTKDDHIETILFRMARGSGLRGLTGIRMSQNGYVRPLLQFSRQQTRNYCNKLGLWYHDDPANSDIAFSRSRIRERIVPEFRLVHPGFDEAMVRLSQVAAEEDEFLDGAAASALEHAEIPLNGELRFLSINDEMSFRAEVLSHLPPVLFRRAIRLAARAIGAELSALQGELVMDGIRSGISGSVTAEGGLHVLEWRDNVFTARSLIEEEPFRYNLQVPGITEAETLGWMIQARQAEVKEPVKRASLTTAIKKEGARNGLYFRSFQEGDMIQPLGFSGMRKVSDLLGESKLTALARKRLPIICDIVGPIWIPGVCVSERIAAQLGEEALVLSFGPFSPDTTETNNRA